MFENKYHWVLVGMLLNFQEQSMWTHPGIAGSLEWLPAMGINQDFL